MSVSGVHTLSIVSHMPDTHSIRCNNFVVRRILFESSAVASNRAAIVAIFQLFRLSFVTATMMAIREPENIHRARKERKK